VTAAAALTFAALRALAVKHGFADPDTAAAVAMAESMGRPDATLVVTRDQADAYNASHDTGTRHGPERSFGLWQINTLAHPGLDESKLLDPEYNATAAYLISNGGKDWRPWSTYTSGAYRRFMPPATVDDLAPNATALLEPDPGDTQG
jgi:hypothetical protein